MIIASRS